MKFMKTLTSLKPLKSLRTMGLVPALGGLALLGAVAYGGKQLWVNRARVKSALNISGVVPTLTDAQLSTLASADLKVLMGQSSSMDTYWLEKARKLIGVVPADATVRAGYFFASSSM